MTWNDIIGQQRVQRLLHHAIADNRLPQALILSGMEGVGKMAIALAFAQTVNCERPVRTASMVTPCGTCHACQQCTTLQHPNVRLTMALPSGKGDNEQELKSDVIDELKGLMQAIAEDPYTTVRLAGATQIRIGQIRELKRTLSLSAAQEGRRVCIIVDADDMTTEASNAFLKTLEEPHEGVTIILTTSHPERMMQTIVSRCQEIVCPPLDDTDIAGALAGRNLCSLDEAQLIAPFAQGSFTRARSFLSEDMRGYREDVVNLLRTALRGKGYRIPMTEAVTAMADGRDKVRVEMMLTLLLLWLRDAYAISMTGVSASIMNGDQREALTRFSDGFTGADYPAALTAIEQAVRQVHRNVNLQLVLLPMLLTLRRIFGSARKASSGTIAS